MYKPRMLVVLLMLAMLAFACGGDSGTTSEERPLGTDESEVQTPIPIPTVATPPSPTPAPTPEAFIYVVRSGDTLGSIAAEFGTSLDAIIAVNQLTDPDKISIGQEVEIPQDAPIVRNSDGTVRPGERTHIVVQGETLLGIAEQYNKTLDEITIANNIPVAAILQIGQQLIIPAATEE